MNEVRRAYLESLEVARALVASAEVAARWNESSALQHWTVGGLCGHLTRAFVAVPEYLDADPDPDDELVDAAGYYAAAVHSNDLDSDLHRGIRQRGDEIGAQGHAEVVRIQQEALAQLRQRMETEPEIRKLRVFKGMVIRLDDYLATRLVEITLHIDDVAISVGVPTPQLPTTSMSLSIETLVATARHRHGDLAVLRALGRRERDEIEALRVL